MKLMPPAAKKRQGYALLIVMIVVMTTTALAAAHQRHLNTKLRLEQARVRSEIISRGPRKVLAKAVDLLETGDAPAPVDYQYSHTSGSLTRLYRVSYRSAGNTWTVTAEPDPTAGTLADLPTSF
tara:strand:- start:134197 stop:134568 length:372 start_codon:yes stop_codon:yes gene_type:complete